MTNRNTKKLSTDKNTDLLLDYFINEDKFDDQLKQKWDNELQEKLENLKSANKSSKKSIKKSDIKSSKKSESENKENLKLYMLGSSQEKDKDVDFTDSVSSRDKSDSISLKDKTTKTLSANKIKQESAKSIKASKKSAQALKNSAHAPKNSAQSPKKIVQSPKKPIREPIPVLLDTKLIDNTKKFIETPEEKRARQRTNYAKLQDLVTKKNVTLYQKFTIDSDPDIMEEEYKLHENKRKKENQVKFYKNILINVISGIEFLNDKYDPFDFKLKDWSRQVATDMDDYTEVLEELYDKHRNKMGKMSPEIKLLFMIVMSGVTYHISQALFGSAGLGDAVKNNPNVLNKLIGGLMKDNKEIDEKGGAVAPNNQQILEKIRNLNKKSETKEEPMFSPKKSEIPKTSESNIISVLNDKKLSPTNTENHTESIGKITNSILNSKSSDIKKNENIVLSNATIKPNFNENTNNNISEKKSPKIDQSLNDIIESLDSSSSNLDLSDILNKSSQKNSSIKSIQKNNSSIKSAKNSNTKSTTKKNAKSDKNIIEL